MSLPEGEGQRRNLCDEKDGNLRGLSLGATRTKAVCSPASPPQPGRAEARGLCTLLRRVKVRGPPFFSASLINMSMMFLGPGMCCVYWGRRVIPHVSFSFRALIPEEWGGQIKLGIRRKKKQDGRELFGVQVGGNLSEPLGLCCCHQHPSNSLFLPPEQAFNSLISVGSSSRRISYREGHTEKKKKPKPKIPHNLKCFRLQKKT